MKVIILGLTPYKEKDVIVNAINEDSYLSFSLKGALEGKNKNSGLKNPFTIADITLSEGNSKYKTVKNSEVIYSPLMGTPSLEYMTALSLLAECFKSLLQDEEKPLLFNMLEKALYEFRKQEHPHLIILSLLAEIITIGGYELSINACSNCGKKNEIVGFSFLEGGLICKECFKQSLASDLNLAQTKIIRNAFLNKSLDLSSKDYDIKDLRITLFKLLEFIYDCYGVKFKNIEFL